MTISGRSRSDRALYKLHTLPKRNRSAVAQTAEIDAHDRKGARRIMSCAVGVRLRKDSHLIAGRVQLQGQLVRVLSYAAGQRLVVTGDE